MLPDTTPLLDVQNLYVQFPANGGETVRAVDGVSFSVERGETLGLVGESGCGKSTTGRALLRLLPAHSGRVQFGGTNVLELPEGNALRDLRKRMQMVFQDPFASLSPRLTVGQIVQEPLQIHGVGNRAEQIAKVDELLNAVGMNAQAVRNRFPHEFSGGQRQRVGIARALALDPQFLVLDEPVSALDISVRAQVVNLLTELQETRGMAYLFIGHDLSLIRRIARRVAVMYLGRIVETAPSETLYQNPRHPYTRSLFESVPVPDPTRRRPFVPLTGDPPSPLNIPSGCRFRTRCKFAQKICAEQDPPYIEIGDAPNGGIHTSACHFALSLPVWNEAAN